MVTKFTEFLTEAAVSNKNLEKTMQIFQKYMQKKIGQPMFRFGGAGYFTLDVKNGVGALFIYEKVKALRINYIKGEITSVSLWKKYKVGKKADMTIILNGANLLKALEEIVEIITSGSKSSVTVFEENFKLTEDALLAEMAKSKVSPEDFYTMLVKAGVDIKRVSGLEAREVAASNNVSVPGAFNKLKVVASEKVNNKKVDYHDATALKNPEKIPGGKTIIVTSGDAGMTVPEDNKRFDDLEKKGNIFGEEPETPATMEELKKRVGTLFYKMSKLVTFVTRGLRYGLIIYGGPGIGKTFVVTKTLKEEGVKYTTIKGKITTSKVYETLFMNREITDIILFDDTDSIWNDADAANVLKAALDSYEVRLVSWNSARTMNVSKMGKEQKEDYIDSIDQDYMINGSSDKKLPSEFEFKGKIIFISNLPRDKFDSAVLTRVAQIDMDMTTEEIFARMEGILEFVGPKTMKMSDKIDILANLRESHIKMYGAQGKVKPSIRKLENALMLKASGIDDWELFLDNV